MAKITYKINRLSNTDLEFGLKTGSILTGGKIISGTTRGFEASQFIKYNFTPALGTSADYDNVLVHKKYVDDQISSLTDIMLGDLSALLTAGDGISVTPSTAEGSDNVGFTIALAETGIKTYNGETNEVIASITTDKYGRVASITPRRISISDLNITANTGLDNFIQWNVKVGSAATSSANTFAITSGHKDQIGELTLTEITSTSKVGMALLAGNGLTVTPTARTGGGVDITYAIDLVNDGPVTTDTDGKITLKTLNNSNTTTPSFSKLSWDSFGRVTGATAVAQADIDPFLSTFTGAIAGYVPVKTTTNILTDGATPGSDGTYFLTSDGKWASAAFDHVKVEHKTSGTTAYRIMAAADTNASTTAITTPITITGGGTLTATAFSGNGASLTNLSAANLTGTIPEAVISNSATYIKKVIYGSSGTVTEGNVLIGGSGNTVTTLANATSGGNNVLTSNPSKSSGTPQWVSIDDLVGDIAGQVVSQTGGFVFKGLLGGSGNYSDLPSTGTDSERAFYKGYFFRVAQAGTYAGHKCEVGDAVYAIKDWDSAYPNADNSVKSTYWGVLEQNLTDALTRTTETLNSGVVAVKAAGSTYVADGLAFTYSDSKWTLSTDITGNAGTATKWATARTIAGISIDGSEDKNSNLEVANIKSIAVSDSAGNVGTAAKHFNTIYADTFVGALTGDISGNASTADKVNKDLTITIGGTNTVFNGSEAKTVTLSANTLGYVSAINNPASDPATGQVIEKIAFSKDAATGVVTTTATYKSIITGISSTPFNVTNINGSVTIGFKTSKTAGTFDTSTTNPDGTTRLNYGGYLYATKLYSGATEVATLVGTGKENKIATLDANGQYKSSGVAISDNSATNTSTDVLTSKAVHDAITDVAGAAIRCAALSFGAAGKTTATTTTIPANAIIDHIDVYVAAAYGGTAPTFELSVGNDIKVLTTEIDLTGTGDVFSYKIAKAVASATTASVTLGASSGTAGSGKAYVYYVANPVA